MGLGAQSPAPHSCQPPIPVRQFGENKQSCLYVRNPRGSLYFKSLEFEGFEIGVMACFPLDIKSFLKWMEWMLRASNILPNFAIANKDNRGNTPHA